jgi:hypothetical protein
VNAHIAWAWFVLVAASGAPVAGATASGTTRYELSQTHAALRGERPGESRYAVTGSAAFAQPVPGTPKRYEIHTAAKLQATDTACAAGPSPIVFNDGFEDQPLAVR